MVGKCGDNRFELGGNHLPSTPLCTAQAPASPTSAPWCTALPVREEVEAERGWDHQLRKLACEHSLLESCVV